MDASSGTDRPRVRVVTNASGKPVWINGKPLLMPLSDVDVEAGPVNAWQRSSVEYDRVKAICTACYFWDKVKLGCKQIRICARHDATERRLLSGHCPRRIW